MGSLRLRENEKEARELTKKKREGKEDYKNVIIKGKRDEKREKDGNKNKHSEELKTRRKKKKKKDERKKSSRKKTKDKMKKTGVRLM